MHVLTRRDFTLCLMTSAISPLGIKVAQSGHLSTGLHIPDSVAGHLLTAEEKELALKFCVRNEENLSSLRGINLPNNLGPALCYASELSPHP